MRYTSLLLTFLCAGSLWSQSLDKANEYFERYEYAMAAEGYRDYAKSSPLPKEDYKRYAYSCFVIGAYEECLPLSDSIIGMSDTEPFFYYMNGEVNMGNRNYEKAKESYEKYQSLDSEYDVSVKIASCAAIPDWNQEVHLKNTLLIGNTTKANLTGPNYLDGILYYSEIGKDSLGENMGNTNIDHSELVLARPFTKIGGIDQQILIKDTIGNLSVPSIAIDHKNNMAWVTVAQPLAEEQIDMVPHLYIGAYSKQTHEITDLKPWQYSGYEDTTACAHVTINESGNMIVFTKMGDLTSGADLYKSDLVDGSWTKPQSIISLNTEMDEMYPLFIGDSLLSFASDGKPGYGGLDIFIADVNSNGMFGFVRHLKAPVNSFKDDFNFYYYSADSARYTSNREGGIGDDDMYFVKFSEPVVEPVADSSDFKDFVNDWDTPIVYFDFDKFDIKEDVKNLEGLIKFLGDYPKSSITIEGHTDSRGSTDYNYNLGYKRAETVKAELIARGISAGQISVKSKGEEEPQVQCSPCTELMHAKNRVALIKLNAL